MTPTEQQLTDLANARLKENVQLAKERNILTVIVLILLGVIIWLS